MAGREGGTGSRHFRKPENKDKYDNLENYPIHRRQPELMAPFARDNLTAPTSQRISLFKRQQGIEDAGASGSNTMDRTFERFLRFNPPEFHGSMNGKEAEHWLDQVERIFALMGYAEEQPVVYGVSLLDGAARNWWCTVKERWIRDRTPCTWVNFTKEFCGQYTPPEVRGARLVEFYTLGQGSMTVMRYEAELRRLSRYEPSLEVGENEKVKQFVLGLRPSLRNQLLPADLTGYARAIRVAVRIEQDTKGLEECGGVSHRSRNTSKTRSGKSLHPVHVGRMGKSSRTNTESRKPTRSRCTFCNKGSHEKSQCWRKLGRCLRCGSDSHRVNTCRRSNQSRDTTKLYRVDARGRPGENAIVTRGASLSACPSRTAGTSEH